MDRKRSEYEVTGYYKDGKEWIDNVTRLVVDETPIKKGTMMLRMDEMSLLLVHDELKNMIEKEATTGIFFIKPEQYPDTVKLWSEQRELAKKSR